MSTALVKVRWLVLETIPSAAWPALTALLDDEERARAARFYFDRDREAFIAAHALLRVLLSSEAALPAADWRFSVNAFGKPEAILVLGSPPLRFNLSHTHGLVAAALTCEHDIGVDVEKLDPERLSLDLATRFFAPQEIALLRAVPVADLTDALYGIWTLKEACIKAIGTGLSLPLDSFALTLDPLAVAFSEAAGAVPATWLLRRLYPTAHHTLALALCHPNPGSVSLDACALAADDVLALARQASVPGGGQMGRM